ncbi:MAG: hypothetical protein ACI8X5_003050 [Planctomycetota bacterium]|jgi:hypothetical protein
MVPVFNFRFLVSLAACAGTLGTLATHVKQDTLQWNAEDETQFPAERLARLAQDHLTQLEEDMTAHAFDPEWQPADLFTPGFESHNLRPALDLVRSSSGLQAWIAKATGFESELGVVSPAKALANFLDPLRDGDDLEIHFKIVGVSAGAAGGFQVSALLQTSAKLGPGARQQNAKWQISFVPAGPDGQLHIALIRGLELTEASVERQLFRDVSSQTLAGAGGSSALLSAGSERWHGALDDLGEPNFFGHNGIAVGDVNGDDLDDLYVAQGTGLPNMLFVQQTDGTFQELAEPSGVAWLDDTKGVLLVDLDNDGDRDLACCIGPLIVLCTNDGAGIFTPARSLRTDSDAAFYSLSAADYDLDGDLDLYALRYVDTAYGESVPMPFHDARNGPPNILMRNEGERGFFDVTAEVGLDSGNDRFSLASSWSDYDFDGDPDLYVANDFGRNNLYRNEGGRFVNVAADAGCEDQAAGMGVSWADVDLDGRIDLLVSNMFSSAGRRIAYQPSFKADETEIERDAVQRHALGNSLFCQDPKNAFKDESESAGLRMGRWSWGARFTDFDMDGLPDVFVPNGFLTGDRDDDL